MARCKHKRCCLFLAGVGMGAVAGILLAPKSGSEIRRELFGGPADIKAEPGTAAPQPPAVSEDDLKTKIEETRARLKAEIEAQQE